ncbi:hypothetical protein GbCGDNIH6_8174 [Granulibacter bethesdensis]|nr:hypothetical protein GbCGDNIH6_8174 [Granulibacter bethesdensis]
MYNASPLKRILCWVRPDGAIYQPLDFRDEGQNTSQSLPHGLFQALYEGCSTT